ncbi:MAG TPA: amidohydrolase family protein [Candidatus Limnocylindria bacterium]|nr:amidohydrolase family protein [Candidatus Limnocylindria bacterium]
MTSPPTTLLRNALVLPRAGSDGVPGDVLIEGSRIASVERRIEPAASMDVVDLSNHALVPGFFNAHYHSHDVLAKGMFEAMPLEAWSVVAGGVGTDASVEEVRLRTLLGATECVRNGFTTVQDFVNLPSLEDAYVDAMLEAYAEAGVRVVFAISVRDRSQLDTIPWSRELLPEALHAALDGASPSADVQLEFVERQLRRHPAHDRLTWALAASAPHRCSPTLLSGLADLAERWSLPVYTHLYETRMQRAFARRSLPDHRGSLVEYLADCGLLGQRLAMSHAIWTVPREIERIADAGASVVLNLLSNFRLGSGLAPIGAYRRAAVNIALGGDNLSCSDVENPFQAMKLFCLAGGLDGTGAPPTAADALHAATVGGATTAGLSHELGAIEPGMLADLVALDLDDPAYRPLNDLGRQLVFAETARGVRHVWVAGRRVVQDGRCSGVDERQLVERVREHAPRVRAVAEPLWERMTSMLPAIHRIMARAEAVDEEANRYLA